MGSKVLIEPVTRIEGHGKVTIRLDEKGEVEEARLHVTQFRGFEKFCEGRPFWEMPVITSRICGICPVSHHLASVKACDALLGVKIPPTARMLRELMHMAQIVQSHALHFFYLASPDILMGMDAEPARRNVLGLIDSNSDVALRGMRLRKFGQEILAVLGGKRVHPNAAIPGGMSKALSRAERDTILQKVDGVIEDVRWTLALVKAYYTDHLDEVCRFASFPTGYMGLTDEEGNEGLYDGKIRLRDADGVILEDYLDPATYLSIVVEKVEDWSYMKSPYYRKDGCPKGVYRVGPLARLNVVDRMGTPIADAELRQFRNLSATGIVEGSMYYHYARLIETLYCVEKMKSLLEDERICSTEVQVTTTARNEEGVGVIEAPRGTLIHHYWIDKGGLIRRVNLIVATGHNNAAINAAITNVAKGYVRGNKLTEGALNRVEAAIRCYDPCLSCATHALGEMPLEVHLVSHTGETVEERRVGG